jgi:glycosyltransferase WbpL
VSPAWLPPLAALLSALACAAYLWLARRRQWLDHPNQRSSHQRPTPHGGGVPIVLSLVLATALGSRLGIDWPAPYGVLLALALLLMALGVVDDRLQLSVRLRFAIYTLCCALVSLGLLLPLGGAWWCLPVTVLLLWLLNLYNFMDGIDGIASIQAFLACAAAALLSLVYRGATEYALFCLLLGCCHLGFLVWNFPPARLFMGDAGSVPTGFLLGGLALLGEVSGALPATVWLVLLAGFLVDASWTLVRRMLRGDDFTRPHREHLYQRLSRHWGSHLAVDLALIALLGLWLMPMAWAVMTFQQYQLFLVILAYLPLLLCMAKFRQLT